eukprot:gene45564-57159_t
MPSAFITSCGGDAESRCGGEAELLRNNESGPVLMRLEEVWLVGSACRAAYR